jgi:hypothetical protein
MNMLAAIAQGDAQLLVEERLPGEAFGKGKKVPQTFAQVVKQCRAGDDSHYLTTQEVCTPPTHPPTARRA